MPASINDYGGASPDTLESPPQGGPEGWAAAVPAALNLSDTTVVQGIVNHKAESDPDPNYMTPAEHAATNHA
ncbi:hypothetical protein QCD71_25235, partial [Sphingomonas sp. PsM26]|nr:hypothetical protein [Sphingomonas sp. PsM26]